MQQAEPIYPDGVPPIGRIIFPRNVKSRLFHMQRGKCLYCGRTLRIGSLEIDHKFPVSRGGGNEWSNLQLLCIPCNMRKGIQSDAEFRRRYRTLVPRDGSSPIPPVPQADFNYITTVTRAAPRCDASTTNDLLQHAGGADIPAEGPSEDAWSLPQSLCLSS